MNKKIIFSNWIKYDKKSWIDDMRRALDDIEQNNGENVYDILEDYYEETSLNEVVDDVLEKYTQYFLDNGYCDTDVFFEKPTAIERFKEETK
jgi:hypothetical protein